MQNWRTTACGAAIAIVTAIQNYNGQNTWQGYATAAGIALLGYLAKDQHGQ